MRNRILLIFALAAVIAVGPLAGVLLAQGGSIFIPLLVYRTGP